MEPQDKMEQDWRFRFFLMQLSNVGCLYPREYYLYRLMKTVAFHDLEIAMMNTIQDYANDAQEELIGSRQNPEHGR